jgi:hypothetical protein
MAAKGVELEGMTETLKAVRGIKDALERKEANAELRRAARECAGSLAADLARAAAGCGVPVAPRVARSIRVKSDRLPSVSIGDRATGPLVWGSEQGPKSDPNRFAVSPNASGYWIAPTVARFQGAQAVTIYQRAVVDIFKAHGLL